MKPKANGKGKRIAIAAGFAVIGTLLLAVLFNWKSLEDYFVSGRAKEGKPPNPDSTSPSAREYWIRMRSHMNGPERDAVVTYLSTTLKSALKARGNSTNETNKIFREIAILADKPGKKTFAICVGPYDSVRDSKEAIEVIRELSQKDAFKFKRRNYFEGIYPVRRTWE